VEIFLETDRLLLRKFTEDDVGNLYDLNSDPEVMHFLTKDVPTPREVIRSQILPRFLRFYELFEGRGFWAAIEQASGDFLGWFAFTLARDGGLDEAELGFRLRRSAWGKGYGTEGSRALIRQGFTELGVQRVFAQTMAVNLASRRVMEKAGLTLARTFYPVFDDPIDGTELGEVEYAMCQADWVAHDAGRAE
jgi:RimJ/RimL family protein N-acetyltransferase